MPALRAIRHAAIAALFLAASACASLDEPAPSTMVVPGTTFTLAPGGIAALPGGDRLRYAAVTADSRCPPDVQCVWAGEATVAFDVLPAGGMPQRISLVLPREPVAVAGAWRIHLLELARGEAPAATVRVDPR
jgi:hypothetical protein